MLRTFLQFLKIKILHNKTEIDRLFILPHNLFPNIYPFTAAKYVDNFTDRDFFLI